MIQILWTLALPLLAADVAEIQYGKQRLDISHLTNRGEFLMRMVADETDESLVWLDHSLKGSFLYRTQRSNKGWDPKTTKEIFNFGKRSLWEPRFNPTDKQIYLVSDDQNDETFNTYHVNLHTGTLDQVTETQYQPNFGFNAKGTAILSVGRLKKTGGTACLKETSLTTKKTDTLICDQGDITLFPWGDVHEDPTAGYISLVTTHNSDRSRKNIRLFQRGKKAFDSITDESQPRVFATVLGWESGRLYFIANDGKDVPQLRRYTPAGAKTEVLLENSGFATLDGVLDPKHLRVLLYRRTTDDKKGEAIALDLKSGAQKTFDASDVDLYLGWNSLLLDGSLAVSGRARKDPSRLLVYNWHPDTDGDKMLTIGFEKIVATPPPSACEGKVIDYPTFDQDPDTGKTRRINAALFTPVKPRSGKPAGLVYAHGGPSGRTTPAAPALVDFLCSLGYTVLGANPRGSTGSGQAFEDLNNGDWGGGDYQDYEYGRRYLEAELGIARDRIGITGGSFGGYMTNWAMTRPDNAFGFGISDYGMADLIYQVKNSVVGDNTTSDMGDPVAKAALYKERSPMTHAANIAKPFLLTHGSRDVRTVVQDTRDFVAELRKQRRDVRYVELPGEGHGYRYPDTLLQYYSEIARFLEDTAFIDP